MLKSSYYNHVTMTGDPGKVVLFNKFWGSVALVDERTAAALRSGNLADLEADRLAELERSGFLVAADLDERAAARERYVRAKETSALLAITVELTQECNLACTFCYQNSYRTPGVITWDAIEKIQRYINAVIGEGRRPVTDISLRFIGGEPLMQKKTILRAVEAIRGQAERLGVVMHTQIDTNGLLLDEAVVREMDTISITLTNKADHDTVRVRHNGAGSYDQIVKRIRRHAGHFNAYETILAVRYNVKGLGVWQTEFDLYNTVNYDYNVLVPTLTREQFKKLYMEIVRLKVEHGETITDFPRPTFAPCTAYTPYNLKITADGRLALCDAMHSPIGALDDLVGDVGRHLEIFSDTAGHNPFDDPQCGTCTNVGICGGKLFCKTNPHAADNDPCDFLPFDMDEFLAFFAETYPAMPERFDLGASA
jgi:radical SAM protein with 4Fe4S-binding SPASM domain